MCYTEGVAYLLSFIVFKAVSTQLQACHLTLLIVLAVLVCQIACITVMVKAPKAERWYMVLFSSISAIAYLL